LFGHVLKPEGCDDRIIIRELKEVVKNDDRLIFIDDTMLASQARKLLTGGILTITGRMHPAISSFSLNTPAISLSYSVKYQGIIGNDLGLNELVVDAKGDDRWGDHLAKQVIKKLIIYWKTEKKL